MAKINQFFHTGAIDKLVTDSIEIGYDLVQIREGVLGHGDFILIAPPGYWNIKVTEVAVNCWTSLHTVERRRNIPKTWLKEIAAAEIAAAE